MMWWSFLVVLVLEGASTSQGANFFIGIGQEDENYLISTTDGLVQGRRGSTINGKPYWTYQGIPYAQPPIGNLRFKAPLPAIPWEGILDATKEKNSCVETYSDSNGISTWGEEDCLYLNVFSPKNPRGVESPLPVFVWIYGGAFMFGNSSSELYGPDYLLEQDDVIVVTFNYRIGLFGFLATGDLSSPGNYGLKDQRLVLQWIQKNIHNFGGDKNRVTIAGQSAGSASMFYHVLSPNSKGLFHRGIANSGSPLCSWAFKKDSRSHAFDLGVGVGIRTKSTKQLVARLRKVDVKKLMIASRLMVLVSLPQYNKFGFPFGPTIEPVHKNAFLTENPYKLMESGRFNRVPIIMGMNTLETTLFWESSRLLTPFLSIYELSPGSLTTPSMNIDSFEDRRTVGNMIKDHYWKGQSLLDPQVIPNLLAYTSDDQFIRPLTRTMLMMHRYTPIYTYVFSYASEFGLRALRGILGSRPTKTGTSHLEEEFYVWKRKWVPQPTGLDKLISNRILKIYKNFMHTGNPTPVRENLLQRVLWPPIQSPAHLTYLNLTENLSLGENFRAEHIEFWKRLYRFGHGPYYTY